MSGIQYYAPELKENTYNLTPDESCHAGHFAQAIFLPVTVIRWKKTGPLF